MPALFFDRCTAPVKLPLRECPSRWRRAASSDHLREVTGCAARLRAFILHSFSFDVGRELRWEKWCCTVTDVSYVLFTSVAPSQSRVTRVKFNRVFFPCRLPVLLAVGSLESSQGQWESRSSIYACLIR